MAHVALAPRLTVTASRFTDHPANRAETRDEVVNRLGTVGDVRDNRDHDRPCP